MLLGRALCVAAVLGLTLAGGAAAGDGGSGTYTASGQTFYFTHVNSGTTAWQAFYLVGPPGSTVVGGATVVGESTARCVAGQPDGLPNEIECSPINIVLGLHFDFDVRMGSSAACGSPFQLYVSSSSTPSFSRVADATLAGSCAPAPPPQSVRPPVIHGKPVVGRTLTATPPAWTSSPSSVFYRWQRCTGSRCVAIAGATTLRLKLVRGDAHHSVRIVATASIDGQDVESRSREVPVR